MSGVYIAHQYKANTIAVRIVGGDSQANRVAQEVGMVNKGQIGSLKDFYIFEIQKSRFLSRSYHNDDVLKGHEHVLWFEEQTFLPRVKRHFQAQDDEMNVLDPYWRHQWYMSCDHSCAEGDFHLNVEAAWRDGVTGKGVVVTVVDDGIEWDHPDLTRNYDQHASYDVKDGDSDPKPRYDLRESHGTMCAGQISAEANNTACGIGVAPDSRIGGIRLIDRFTTDAGEAAALTFNNSYVDIYSCSWGPVDSGSLVEGPRRLTQEAFMEGVSLGRGGKGSIFVWAAGNGGLQDDSCSCDGYVNSIYTMAINSLSDKGLKPLYTERCSSILATTYSKGWPWDRGMVSTYIRHGCTKEFHGTSASAPLAAGIVALALEANPDLTWRDVQHITVMTSRTEPIRDGEWVTNGVNRSVSLAYGYGLMDAHEMVKLARRWTTVPGKHECVVTSLDTDVRLERNSTYRGQVTTDGCGGTSTEVRHLEHVQVRVSLSYSVRGDVSIYLTSPSGTRTTLLPSRHKDTSPGGFNDWPFMSVWLWGEDPRGVWTVEVEIGDRDFGSSTEGGKLEAWSLVIHGTVQEPVRLVDV